MYFLSQVKGCIAHSDKSGKPEEVTKWQLSVGGALLHSADFPAALSGFFTVLPLEKQLLTSCATPRQLHLKDWKS